MRRHTLALLATLSASVAACSSPPSVSTPALSALQLAATATRGGTESGTFVITNAAGVGGLFLHLTLTDPSGVSSPSAVEPLAVSGAASQTAADGQVSIVVPANGPVGTYSVALTVSDGTMTSNALTGTFVVD